MVHSSICMLPRGAHSFFGADEQAVATGRGYVGCCCCCSTTLASEVVGWMVMTTDSCFSAAASFSKLTGLVVLVAAVWVVVASGSSSLSPASVLDDPDVTVSVDLGETGETGETGSFSIAIDCRYGFLD